MKNLDEIGTEAAKLLQGMESSRKLAQPLLKQIWEAFDNAKKNRVSLMINGATSKSQWAEKAGVSLRHCQYLVRDGSRKRSEKKDANRVRVLDGVEVNLEGYHAEAGNGWVSVEFEKSRIEKYNAKMNEKRDNADWSEAKGKNGVYEWQHKIREISGNVNFRIEDKTLTEKQVVAALLKKMREGLKVMRLWDDRLTEDFKEYAKEDAEYQAEQKEARSERAKKAAATRKKRQTPAPVIEAATKIPAKPVAKRATKCPPQRGRTRGKANQTVNGIQRFLGTHTLLNSTITHCGIYYSDAPTAQFFNTCDVVNENPDCPACKWHLKRGVQHFKKPQTVDVVITEKALTAAVDGASEIEEKTWAQKVCIPGSPEREQWHKDLAWRREHPAIDPNADDEFAGEGD